MTLFIILLIALVVFAIMTQSEDLFLPFFALYVIFFLIWSFIWSATYETSERRTLDIQYISLNGNSAWIYEPDGNVISSSSFNITNQESFIEVGHKSNNWWHFNIPVTGDKVYISIKDLNEKTTPKSSLQD